MAKDKQKEPKTSVKCPGKSMAIMIVCCVIGFIIAALPTVVVLLVGMIPTIVAYIIDLTPGRYAARCVGGLNIAGELPFLNRLWSTTNDMPAAIAVVTDVYAWLAFYLASGVGWALFISLPSFVASFATYSAKRNANALRERLDELVREWGEDITGNRSEEDAADANEEAVQADGQAAESKPAPA